MTRAYNTATTQQNTGGAIPAFIAGKNKVINGDFGIWQRGTSFSTDGYTADRFAMRLSGGTATTTRQSFTVGQTDVPNNPTYFARLDVTTGDNNCRIETILEDVTLSSGQTFTLSFWAKGTNPAGGSMEIFSRQEFGSGGSTAVATSQGTITLTASWQRFTKTFTYASVSGKTIGANNAYGFDIRQPSADTGAAAWTLDISNVQLENGSVATPFTTATGTIQGELAACQRYFRIVSSAPGVGSSATQIQSSISHPGMRTTPSVALTAVATFTDCAVADYTQSSATMTISNNDADGGRYQNSNFTSITTLRPYILLSSGGKVQLSAEL